MNISDGQFWTFSLRLYGQPGVAEATLALQDGADADVDIVLYILWRASHGDCLDASALAVALGAVAPWRDQVVLPLRAVRRALKTRLADVSEPEAEALRGRVKAEELEAERLQHQVLERLGRSGAAGPADPGAALASYAACLGANFPPTIVATLTAAMNAISGLRDPASV